ncbi:UDP-2,3-diacylglucosamine hydrolase, partial [Yersinia pestis PY-98]
MLMLYIFWVI